MKKHILYFAMVGIVVAQPAMAQELEEIIVTAERREASLQDVPVSVTAFSYEALTRQNLTEAKDFLAITPNVSFTEDGEVGQRSVGISMRGVSDFANTFTGVGGLSNSFGIYLDEFNIANNATKTANPQLHDLERLEILRGPQGTYFGRNATGGALNLTTKLPTDQVEYEFGAGAAEYGKWQVHAIGNAPVSDNFFLRGVVSYEEGDGFLKNLSPTGSTDAYDHMNLRVSARWLISDAFTADLSVMYTEENDGTDSNVNSGISDFDTPGSTPSIIQLDPAVQDVFGLYSDVFPVDSGGGFYPNNIDTIAKDFEERNENESTIVNLRLNYEAENWSIRSVTGIMETESLRRFDQDLTQYSLYETNGGRTGDTISQELRFNWHNDSWDITVGGLYADDDADTYGISPIGSNGFFFLFDPANDLLPDGTLVPDYADRCFCLNPGDIISGPFVDTFDARSWAVFGQADWQVSETVKLTVGMRYTEDTIAISNADLVRVPNDQQPLDDIFNFKQPDPDDPSMAQYQQGGGTFDGVTPRFVLNWKPSESLSTYLSASKGYKPGGVTFLEVPPFPTVAYNEESLWSYEVGAKWRAENGRFSVNAAIFLMDWDDLQIPSVGIAIVNNVIVNNLQIINTTAESKGFELEFQALATDNFLIGGGLGNLTAEFQDFGPDAPFVINNMGFALDGTTLPRSPEWTANLFGQYNFEMGSMNSWVRLEWAYRSESLSDIEAVVSQLPIENTQVSQDMGLDSEFNGNGFGNGVAFPWPRGRFPTEVPAYDVTNLRLGVSGEQWEVMAYVENLFDDNFYTGTQENFGLGGFRIRPSRRIAGINFRFFSM